MKKPQVIPHEKRFVKEKPLMKATKNKTSS
mgnify:CR=1 FL=1